MVLPKPASPLRRFYPVEVLTLAMLLLLSGIIATFGLLDQAPVIFLVNLGLMALLFLVPSLQKKTQKRWFAVFRDWSVLPIIIFIYLGNNRLVPLVHPRDVDEMLVALDRRLFAGHDPTVLLEGATFPFLTEVFQLVYASFYFLPFCLCLLLYRRGERYSFRICSAVIVFGFYLSFLGYYLFPAVGPRFTLDHLQSFSLSGVWVFAAVRDLLDAASNMARDCFPSGHTLVSYLTVVLAYRYLRSRFLLFLVWSVLLAVSTVYLRYHYVADILAGAGLAAGIHLFLLPLLERSERNPPRRSQKNILPFY